MPSHNTVKIQACEHPEMWTIEEVATYWKSHPNTVWNHIKSGRLAAVRLGPRMVRVRNEDLEEFFSSYRSDSAVTWLSASVGDAK